MGGGMGLIDFFARVEVCVGGGGWVSGCGCV